MPARWQRSWRSARGTSATATRAARDRCAASSARLPIGRWWSTRSTSEAPATPPETEIRWWAMAPSPSPDEIELLLDIADAAIERALAGHRAAPPALDSLPPALREPVGVFLTLRVACELKGCTGAVVGSEPLGQAVARLAVSAAFSDPRLPALQPADRAHLTIEISLMSALEPIEVSS